MTGDEDMDAPLAEEGGELGLLTGSVPSLTLQIKKKWWDNFAVLRNSVGKTMTVCSLVSTP